LPGFTVAIQDWDWESLQVFGDHGKVLGHRIKIGSIIELQLSMDPFKLWIKRGDMQRGWLIDLSYEASLDLGPKSEPVRRIIQPLKSHTNLAYFEGVVTRLARRASKSDGTKAIANILIDCGVQLVVEVVVGTRDPLPLGGVSGGDEIIGICGLLGSLSSSRSLFRVPINVKVMDIRPFEDRPKMILLTAETVPQDAIPEIKIDYYALPSPSAEPVKE